MTIPPVTAFAALYAHATCLCEDFVVSRDWRAGAASGFHCLFCRSVWQFKVEPAHANRCPVGTLQQFCRAAEFHLHSNPDERSTTAAARALCRGNSLSRDARQRLCDAIRHAVLQWEQGEQEVSG